MTFLRRTFLQAVGACAVASPFYVHAQTSQRVVVIGGGIGGATALKYLKRLNPALKLTLIEPSTNFIMCPMSNRVVTGSLNIRDISKPYDQFVSRHGIQWVKQLANSIDPIKKIVVAGKDVIPYDRLIVAPGVDYSYETVPGMDSAEAQQIIPHAWKAGEQTQRLKAMLYEMPKGGVIGIHIPKVPYRCPPGPYERASLISDYLKTHNPTAKLFVLDSNPDIQSKKELFQNVWKTQYANILEYVPNAEVESVDAKSKTITFLTHPKQKFDVLNLIPPQKAGLIAVNAGLANVSNRWCGVDFLTYESLVHKGIHVLGDSVSGSPGMPKSGHMANQEAKVCAGAIAALTLGMPVPDMPIIANTCYSFTSPNEAIHVASVHRYDAAKKAMVVVPGSGGLSTAPSSAEALYAMSWAGNIMNDALL